MIKRALDIILSAMGLGVSLPLWVVIAAAIWLDDQGPIFYRQRRVGKGGREFTSIKFRSMVANSDEKWGALSASAQDPRITRLGHILRATAIDELPQLWNILKGDMSIVGPRPEWTELAKRFRQEIPSFDRRHVVRPGLTGLAQIYGHSELPRRQKLRYDLLYITKQNLWLDMRLILFSFLVTFAGGWELRSPKVPRWLGRFHERRPKAVRTGRPLPETSFTPAEHYRAFVKPLK